MSPPVHINQAQACTLVRLTEHHLHLNGEPRPVAVENVEGTAWLRVECRAPVGSTRADVRFLVDFEGMEHPA